MLIHVVKPGEYVYKIARIYNVAPGAIIEANQLSNPDLLAVGQTLIIPGNIASHIAKKGESMYAIAQDFGIPLQMLIDANPQIANPALIRVGQIVFIPQAPRKLGEIYVNGYAYPNIDTAVLESTLPYLTYVSVFRYLAAPDGTLSSIDDTNIIQTSLNGGVAPLMVLTYRDEAHGILSNRELQSILINNIIIVLQDKGYFGVNLDFEYIDPEDKDNYNAFISRLVDRLRPLGYLVTVAVAPKTSGEQQGLLYQAHDYSVIGALADQVIIMTYEWGYTYGPPMAVAPLNEVKRVLDYAVKVIPNEKILMSIPNYGYDWTLPYVKGSRARKISNNEAIALAANVGATIQFDDVAKTPFYHYYDNAGKQHEVWFEDARSTYAKLKLIDIYNLAGVSYWEIMHFYYINWLILDSMYDVIKII